MRIIGLFAIYLWIAACTTTPLFPPEIMEGIKNDTFVFKAWRDQAAYPSTHFISQKVELEGHILKVIPKREGVVILVDGHPITKYPLYDSKSETSEDFFRFAIIFDGMLDPGMLQPGNRLVVVGATAQAGPETVGWIPGVLPHLRAQCLHIWETQGLQNMYFSSSGYMGFYAPKERAFCRDENIGSSLFTGDSHGEGKKGTGS